MTANKTISQRIELNVAEMRPRILGMQYSQVLLEMRPKVLPEEVLQKNQALANSCRNPHVTFQDSAAILHNVEAWLSKPTPSLLLVSAGPRTEARGKEVVAKVVESLQHGKDFVIFTLSQPTDARGPPSLADHMKSLVFQLLRAGSVSQDDTISKLTAAQAREPHTSAEWISLLRAIISHIPRLFLVFEAEDLFRAHHADEAWQTAFLSNFQTLLDTSRNEGTMLKILLVGFNMPRPVLKRIRANDDYIVTSLQLPRPMPPHRRHPMSRRSRDDVLWERLTSRR